MSCPGVRTFGVVVAIVLRFKIVKPILIRPHTHTKREQAYPQILLKNSGQLLVEMCHLLQTVMQRSKR